MSKPIIHKFTLSDQLLVNLSPCIDESGWVGDQDPTFSGESPISYGVVSAFKIYRIHLRLTRSLFRQYSNYGSDIGN